MEQLRLDFNDRDAENHVRIGPAAFRRNQEAIMEAVRGGGRVLVVDPDGNRCEGTLIVILRAGETGLEQHRYIVELDWSTWVDGEQGVPLQHRAFAPVS